MVRAPIFPGGDFVANFSPVFASDPPALSLITTDDFMDGDYRTFVTVEPSVDNDSGPFQLELLSAIIPADAVNLANQAVQNVDLVLQIANLPSATATLTSGQVVLDALTLSELTSMPTGRRGHFELWLVDATMNPQSAGKFLIDGETVVALNTQALLGDRNSSIFDSAGTGIGNFPDPLTAISCFITLEDEGDADASPSPRTILQGLVNAGVAQLDVTGASASGGRGIADFSMIVGEFSLQARSDNFMGNFNNDDMGIVFRRLGGGNDNALAGLDLPLLPAGWRYESWVEERATGRVFSTGKFDDSLFLDDDHMTSPSEFASEDKFVSPGKEFLIDVPTQMFKAAGPNSITEVFVTLEVSPDNSLEPSDLRILEAMVPATAVTNGVGGVMVPLANVYPSDLDFFATMSFAEED